ncbi:hypothetical protein D9758_008312 [Tetrapyrgos nigripes]|uniref:Uncharacterized protein n=1 Tax=Tetrapyrgos nigripes TaxID=182062 RepID=A0A8H5GE99_9AGAR|nr:hypothetical protein D9758_008312 [Tetrapyrgos nigripes]
MQCMPELLPLDMETSETDGSPPNPDMQGYVVRLSCFFSHLGIAILISQSKHSRRSCYIKVLFPMLFILLGTLSSIGRGQLNIADVHFAIIQSRSPVFVYMLLFVLPDLFFKESMYKPTIEPIDLPRKLDFKVLFDRFLASLTILLVLAVHAVLYFDPSAYESGGPAVRSDTKAEIYPMIGLVVCCFIFYEIIIHRERDFRHASIDSLAGIERKEIQNDIQRQLKERDLRELCQSSRRNRREETRRMISPQMNWRRYYWGLFATWGVIARRYPSMIFMISAVLFWYWSLQMNIWTTEKHYEFSYGQFLAMFAAGEIWYKCCKRLKKEDVLRLLSRKKGLANNGELVPRTLWELFGRYRDAPEDALLPTEAVAVEMRSLT